MALERWQEILKMFWRGWTSDTSDVMLFIKVFVQLIYAQVLAEKQSQSYTFLTVSPVLQDAVWILNFLKMCYIMKNYKQTKSYARYDGSWRCYAQTNLLKKGTHSKKKQLLSIRAQQTNVF